MAINKNSKQTNSLNQKNYARRNFIKGAACLGTLFSGSILSRELLEKNYSHTNNPKTPCSFSKLSPDFIYLNSGTEGSMPNCVIKELADKTNQWASNPTFSYETDKVLNKYQHQNREKIASFLSVKKNNICLTDNTTMGLNMVLMGLNFEQTDKVIITNHEHNAIVSPLTVQQQKLGLTVITRDFPAANILRKMNSNEVLEVLLPNSKELRGAKALCVSHVYPTTGIRLPLEALRKKADELNIQYLIVDGAQAFGMLDISKGNDHIKHTDFYACPGHKWLNGPPSTGILYINNDKIRPPDFYPTLSQRMGKYTLGKETFPMAEALQVRGCSNTAGFAAMLTAIEFEQQFGGFDAVESQILALSKQVKNFIVTQAPNAIVSPFRAKDLLSGLTVFFPFSWNNPEKIFFDKKIADFVVNELLKKNIQIRSIGFENSRKFSQKFYALRVSTGIFNTEQQLEFFKQSLEETLSLI